jgi:hypothetical protein
MADCRRRNGFSLRFHRSLPRLKNKKKSTRQRFFNFQENLMKVNEYLPNLDVDVPVWFDALERFYRPWKMAYFRPFSNIISIKTSHAARKKPTSNMAVTIGDVMDDVTCKSSIGVYQHGFIKYLKFLAKNLAPGFCPPFNIFLAEMHSNTLSLPFYWRKMRFLTLH